MEIKNVLLVDDDAGIRLIADLTLSEGAGWAVVQAKSGAEALSVMEHERLDVILLDVMMPGMDGLSVLARRKELGLAPSVPVILMTAKVQVQEMAAYSNLDVAGVISKPFDPVTLPASIRQLCLRWQDRITFSRVALAS